MADLVSIFLGTIFLSQFNKPTFPFLFPSLILMCFKDIFKGKEWFLTNLIAKHVYKALVHHVFAHSCDFAVSCAADCSVKP